MAHSAWHRSVLLLGSALLLAVAGPANALLFQAQLTPANEVPAPTGTSPKEKGTGVFLFDSTSRTFVYQMKVKKLTGPPVAAHLHAGAAGVAGPIIVPLDISLKGTSGPLPLANLFALFGGDVYANVHTQQNPAGEARGQLVLVKCSCASAASAGKFKACVRKALKQVPKAARTSPAIVALKKSFAKASCGKTKGSKNAVACCLPASENIVQGGICAPVSEGQCTKLGGTSRGAGSSCFPSNPCPQPASPSAAFLDGDVAF